MSMLQSHSADFELSPAKESHSQIQKIYCGCYGNTEIKTDIDNLVNLSHHKGTVAWNGFLDQSNKSKPKIYKDLKKNSISAQI